MRREQVLKICLNHVLTPDIQYLPKDEKTWLFHAADFSEGEISRDQFCVRFKTAEIAQEFKKAVADALERAGDKHGKKNAHESGCNRLFVYGVCFSFVTLAVLVYVKSRHAH